MHRLQLKLLQQERARHQDLLSAGSGYGTPSGMVTGTGDSETA